jgi:hypothetical protein
MWRIRAAESPRGRDGNIMKRILLTIALALSASILTAFAIQPFKGESPAEYANDPKSDLSGASFDFITAVAQEDAIHELEKNPKTYKGKKNDEIDKLGQARALRHNLRANDAVIYYETFGNAIQCLEAQYDLIRIHP